MKSSEIRTRFLKYFERNAHTIVPSSRARLAQSTDARVLPSSSLPRTNVSVSPPPG